MQNVKQIQKIYNMLTFYDRYYDVIKCWAKNSKKNQNRRRKLKLVSNDTQFQPDSENI